MNGRVYDPGLGRFLSVDPVFQFPTNTQSLNPYTYVLNSPLSHTDPTGLCTDDPCEEQASGGKTAGNEETEGGGNKQRQLNKTQSDPRSSHFARANGKFTQVSINPKGSIDTRNLASGNANWQSSGYKVAPNQIESVAARFAKKGSHKSEAEVIALAKKAQASPNLDAVPGSQFQMWGGVAGEEFNAAVVLAMAHAIGANEGQQIHDIEGGNQNVLIVFAAGSGQYNFVDLDGDGHKESHVVLWDHKSGIRLPDGKLQSPATSLIHEIAHAHDMIFNRAWAVSNMTGGALPEMHIINGVERRLAEYYGEGVRTAHNGTPTKMQCTICTW